MNKEELELDVKTLASIANYWEINENIVYYPIDYQYIEELYREADGNIENMFLLVYELIKKDIERQKSNSYAELRASGDQQVLMLKKIINKIEAFDIYDDRIKIKYNDGCYSRYYQCTFQEWIRIIKSEVLNVDKVIEHQTIRNQENIDKITNLLQGFIDNYTLDDITYKYGNENATVNTELYRHLKPYYRFLEDTIFKANKTSTEKTKARPIYLHICSKLELPESNEALIKKYLKKSIEKLPSNLYHGLTIMNK